MFGTIGAAPSQPACTPTRRDAQFAVLCVADGTSIKGVVQRLGWKPDSARAMIIGLRSDGYQMRRCCVGGSTICRVSL